MKTSRPLNSVLRKSLIPFMIIGIIVSMAILLPLEALTLFRIHRDQQRELTGAMVSSIRKYVRMADNSLLFLSGVIDDAGHGQLHTFDSTFDFFNQLSYADSEGGIIASTSPRTPFSNISSMIEEASPSSGLAGSFSRPYISPVSGKLTVNAVLPMENGGHLLGEINLDFLQEQVLETTGTSENRRLIFIADRFGNLLAHPDRTLLEQQTNWGSLPLLRKITEKNSMVEGLFRIEGKSYLATGIPVSETDWILIDAVPLTEMIFDMIGFVLLINGLFILLFLMLLLTTSGIIRKSIVNPLTYMFHILERSVIEEYPRQIDIENSGFSELDTILRAFNTMSEKVRSNTEKLSRFERAVSEAGYAIYMTDPDGAILYVNPAFERITGYSQAEALGKNPYMLSSGEVPKTYFSSMWDTILNGGIWEEEIVNRRKDGTLYYANQTVAPISGEEGRISSFVAIQIDITQQKESQRRLRESETLYRNLFENAADSILLIDSGTLQIRECNQAAHTILGYSRDELKQLTYDKLLHPEISSAVLEQLSASSENGRNAFESRHLTRDGKVREVMVHMTGLSLGSQPFFLAVVHDVTRRKQAEEAIRQSEQKYRLLAENSTDMISQHDMEGRYIYASPACERLLGYSQQELIGVNAYTLFHPEDLERIEESHKVIVDGGSKEGQNEGIASVTYRIRQKEGTYIWFETLSRTIENGIIAISRDVSERVKMEKDLEKAKDEAEAANRAKSIFLANMSHEIRTPMNSVLGFNELISRHLDDPKLKQYTGQVEKSGRVLLTLIGDILDFSRIEAGKLQLSFEPFSPRRLSMDIVSMFGIEAEKKGLKFKLLIEEQVPPAIILDETRVRQILINLAGNALKFTEKGSLELIVRADYHPAVSGKCGITFSIRDTGIGIPDKEQENIFEAFRQTEGQSNRKYGGTGLGLAISKSLAEAMGGTIYLKSRPGGGSTFTLSFPDIFWSSSTSGNVLQEMNRVNEKPEEEEPLNRDFSELHNKELRERWNELRASMVLDDIAAFGETLLKEAEEGEHSRLRDFARDIIQAVENIDIAGLNQLMESDPFSSLEPEEL